MDDNGDLPDEFYDSPAADGAGTGAVAGAGAASHARVRTVTGWRVVAPTVFGPRLIRLFRDVTPQLRKRRVQAGIAAGCAVLIGLGALLIVIGSTAHKDPPRAPSPKAAEAVIQTPTEQLTTSAAPPSASGSVSPTPEPTITASGSIPIRITVPAIGVDANILQLGLNPDKTVQVPALSQVRTAGWYKYSSIPGASGPSVILGHIDSAEYGLGVFFKLGDVKQGNTVTVLRADHMLATFSVTSVAEYPKTAFPSQMVYGTTTGSTLRLVTCGGRFDAATKNYLDNIVVYGNLVSLTHT